MRTVVCALAGSLFFGLGPATAAENPTVSDLVSKIAGQSSELVQSIQRIRLREDLKEAGRAVGQELRRTGVPVSFVPIGARERGQSPTLRVGVKELALDRVQWWLHFSDSEQKHWADIVRFSDVEPARDYYRRSRQRSSGIYAADHLAFLTTSTEERNGVSILVRKDEHLVNVGQDLPFALSYQHENPPERVREAIQAIDEVLTATEALARAIVAPDFVGYIAKAHPNAAEIRELRLTGFAQMWSAVKQNFVFLDQRPNLDWDGVLPLCLPKVARAESHEEYIGLLQEALALLEDDHTRIAGSTSLNDIPALRIESVEGRPVVTEVGRTPELDEAGIAVGTEILEIDGSPYQDLLQQRYRRIPASTPHARRELAFVAVARRLPDGPRPDPDVPARASGSSLRL